MSGRRLTDTRQGLDALMAALNTWNGGVVIISHDERFITNVAKEVKLRFRGPHAQDATC